MLQVISCLSNSIEDHMMGEQDGDEHEHQHSDSCCHDHSHSGHSHALNGKSSHDQQHLEPAEAESNEDPGSDNEEQEDEGEDEDEGQADLVFPDTYSLALAQLLSADSTPVNVRNIRLEGDETKLDLAVTLWKEGIVCVQQPINKKAAKKVRK